MDASWCVLAETATNSDLRFTSTVHGVVQFWPREVDLGSRRFRDELDLVVVPRVTVAHAAVVSASAAAAIMFDSFTNAPNLLLYEGFFCRDQPAFQHR